jgi:hypothetical protein
VDQDLHTECLRALEKPRLDLNDGRWLLGEATRRLVPALELEGWWEGYEAVCMAFAASEDVCGKSLIELRQSLEYMVCDEKAGELLIACSKMVLSAMVVFLANPTGGLVVERDDIHDDLDPLLRKGLSLLLMAAQTIELERYMVEFDAEYPERIKERNEKNRMRFLIRNAVRPSV